MLVNAVVLSCVYILFIKYLYIDIDIDINIDINIDIDINNY